MKDYKLPEDYVSLMHLHPYLGDIKVVEYVCKIWNTLHRGDTTRLLRDDGCYHIILTGKCCDVPELLKVCQWLTCVGVLVTHEKTTVTVEI